MSSLASDPRALLSGYQFLELEGLGLHRARVRDYLDRSGLLGTVLLAPEGINFSLWGPGLALDAWLEEAARTLGMDAPVINRQAHDEPAFLRLKVRIRQEIITFDPGIVPGPGPAAEALDPATWNERVYRQDGSPAVQLVDARNDYEVALGSFEGAMDPSTSNFTEFKHWAETHLDPDRPVAMFCTGGVRCEKAGAWLRTRGFDRVYQLQGGILGYLDQVPREQSRWRGECFVFDDRVSVDGDLQPTGRRVCAGCRRPASGLDASGMPPVGPDGVCRDCGEAFSPARLEGLRERVRQVRLAASRGSRHLGPQSGQTDCIPEGTDQ